MTGFFVQKQCHYFLLCCLFFAIHELQAQPVKQGKLSKVVIDAGHGGKDPGALGLKTYEKNVVLAIALKLGNIIKENYPDVEVIYTRSTDEFIPLHQRADIANKAKADLFISIHANSNPKKSIDGVETYVMGLHTSAANLEVAMKENEVVTLEKDYNTHYEGYDPKSAESFIIFSLIQNTYLDQSLRFSSLIENQFVTTARRVDRGVKQAGFLVLWKTTMPSVLVETGFISNAKEEEYLRSEKGQLQLAQSIFKAFSDYKSLIDSKSSFSSLNDTTNVAPVFPDTLINSIEDPDTLAVVVYEPKHKKETSKTQNDATVYFTIQIKSSIKKISLKSKEFKGFKPIEEKKTSNGYKYFYGKKTRYDDITKILAKTRKSFPDAFIVAYRNGKIVPVKEVLKK
jgi:N-acetylmuramoyl-L-alanine amidase